MMYPAQYSQKPVSLIWHKVKALLWRFWWLLPLAISMGVVIAVGIAAHMPPAYASVGKIMMADGQIQIQTSAVYNEYLDNFYGTQIELMQSLEVRKRALIRVQTQHPEFPHETPELQVGQAPHAAIFNLKVVGQSPAFAQAYLEACMDEFIDMKKKLRLQSSDSTKDALSDELAQLDKEIAANDAAMHEFQKENNIGFLQQEGNEAAVYLAQKSRELADLKIESNLLQMLDLDQNLDRRHADGGVGPWMTGSSSGGSGKQDTFASFGPVADYQKAKQELELLKVQRAQYPDLRPEHPIIEDLDEKIKKQNNLIETLRSQSEEALKTHQQSIQFQIQNLESVIKEWKNKALDLSTRISEFDKIKTKSDRAKEQYERLLNSMNSVVVTKNIDHDMFSILEPASPGISLKPELPKVILCGLGGGLLLSMVVLFIIDQLDDRINSPMEFETYFKETVLARIPREKFRKKSSLLALNDVRLPFLEAFRRLRSSLIFFPVDGVRPKSLIITSALPNEGKTTISANLAITLAFSGANTLLVDADMRRGKLSQLFGVTEGNGFSSILLRTLPWQEIVHHTSIDNLSLISCGPPMKHPAEHLLGRGADHFLQEIYNQYDYVIFDSPPLTLLDDALSLSPKIDGAIVVVRFGVSSVCTTRQAIELLNQRQVNILGVVCNDVPKSESEHKYSDYYRQTITRFNKETVAKKAEAAA